MQTILVENVYKSYGNVRAVDGLSFSVRAGEVFGLLGPNGAGKTTTLEMLVGLRQADSGRLVLMGQDSKSNSEQVRERFGVQLQSTALYERITVVEMLTLFAGYYEHSYIF